MKKFAFLGLFLTTASFATSYKAVALELVDTPLRMMVANNEAKIIRVSFDGEVAGGTCKMKTAIPRRTLLSILPIEIDYSRCQWSTVKMLTRYEIREIDQLIDAARGGVIQSGGPVYCMAVPTRNRVMTADSGQILLQQGTFPCGPQTVNSSKAARRLVSRLQGFLNEYGQL
ncbi:hypothetical protein K2X33_03640 [bacterium]|nr:hypothetical protein [bacterium]